MQVQIGKKRKTKKSLKKSDTGITIRKIPRNKLENALNIIKKTPDDPFFTDRSIACEQVIHNFQQANSYLREQTDIANLELRLRYARTCLLRRDWYNLAKIILLYKPEKQNYHLLQLFSKYASICLSYMDLPLFESLLQTWGCVESVNTVLKRWTSFDKDENKPE